MRGMKWSKLKKQLEERVCESLRRRIAFHMTNYRSNIGHEPETRLWITVDGEELYQVSKLEWLTNWYRLATEIREINRCGNFRNPGQLEGYSRANDDAESILKKRGLIEDYEFLMSLKDYLSLPVADALVSDNPVFQALAIIDSRVGKRRLAKLDIPEYAHPLVSQMYGLRCEAEGITPLETREALRSVNRTQRLST